MGTADDSPSPATSPAERTYALRGLAARDALVFKSMVRLLSGKTRDRWTCVDGDQADLLVISNDVPAQTARRSDTIRPGTQVVRIVPPGRHASSEALALPLRPDELCARLDRASERIDAAAAQPPNAVRRLQLVRWPGELLLRADPQYLRMATLLGTQPTTIEELCEKSGCPLAYCHSFAAVMHGNGVARWILEPQPQPQRRKRSSSRRREVSPGMLERIRSRLNLE